MAIEDLIKNISSTASYKAFKDFYGGDIYDTKLNVLSDEELKREFPDLYNKYHSDEEKQNQTKGLLTKFIEGVKQKAKEITSDTISYIKNTSLQEKGKDAVDAISSIFQGLNIGLKKSVSTIDRLLLKTSFSDKLVKDIQEARDLSPEQIKKEEEELKKNKKGVSKTVFDLSQWLAPSIITGGTAQITGLSPAISQLVGLSPALVQKLATSKAILTGLDFVKDTQLLYNPAEHEGKDDIQTRLKNATENFLVGASFYGGAKATKFALGKLWSGVTYPMKYISQAINDKTIKINEEFFKSRVAGLWGLTLDKIESEKIIPDVLDVLKGKKGITDNVRYFFTYPEWKAIIRTYGADFKNYPKVILLRKEGGSLQTILEGKTPSVEIKEIKGLLPENVLFKKLEEAFLKDSDSFSSSDYILKDMVDGKVPLENINKIVNELEKKGYKVNREKIIETMGKFIENKRAIEDWQLAVMENEVRQKQINAVQDYYKPLLLYKKIYNLIFEKKPGITKVGEAYNKAAKKYGYPLLDEIAEDLRNRGFDIPVGSFEEELLDIVSLIGSKTSITNTKPPKEYNYIKDLYDAIKPAGTALDVEAPYNIAKSELEKIVKAQKNIASGEIKEAENVVKKIKDSVLKEGLEKEIKEVNPNVFDVIQENVNKTGGSKPAKLSLEQIEILFGKYSPNKINESAVNFINVLENKKAAPSEIFSSLNNVLKEAIKNQAYMLEYNKLAERDTNIIKSALANIFSPLRYTHSLALGITGTNQSRQVLALADNWVITQENINNSFGRFLGFIRDNKFLSEKLNDIFDMVKKNGDKVLAEGFSDSRFTPEEMLKVKEYIKATKEILNTINIFRLATGRMPIPERTDYVAPHRLADFILNALAEKKDLVKPDVKMYFKRELDRIGFGGIFSNDLEQAWSSYIRTSRKLISKYQYEFLTTQAGINDTILDTTAEKILSRWKYAAGVQPKDTIVSEIGEMFAGIGDFFKAFANFFQEKILKKDVKVRIPVDEKVLNELGMTENLKNYFPEVFQKGYFEYSKEVFKDATQNLSSYGKSMIYGLQLGMNTSFTILNAFQEYVVGAPLIGSKDVIKGYGKTVLNPILRIAGVGYDSQKLNNLGRFYDLIGKGQTIFVDDKEVILNPLFKILTFNISLTEEKLLRPSGIQSFLAHIKNIPISQELKERLAVEFSKEINFTSSRLYKPTLARVPGVSILFMFTQYPDNLLSRLELATKMVFSNKEAVEFYKYLLTKANAPKEEFDLFLKEIAESKNPTLWNKAVRAGNIGLIISFITIGSYYLGGLFFDAANFLSVAGGFSKEEKDTEGYRKSKEAFSSYFQKRLSPIESVKDAPIISFTKSLVDSIVQKKAPELSSPALNYFKAGADFLFKMPAVISSILNNDEETATALFSDIQDSFFTAVSPTQISRLIDAYDSFNKGYVMSKTKQGRIQYNLEEGENPLQVFLFGRGSLKGYQELQELKKTGDEAVSLRNMAWDYYERYLETKDERYYTLFNKYRNELEKKYGESISLYDQIRRLKEFRKGMTSPERYLKSQPKEIRGYIKEKTEENIGRSYLEKLLNLR